MSTTRQAEEGLSVGDQGAQIERYCAAQGYDFIGHYVDPGVSGTDQDRPHFQLMLADAKAKPARFDVIVCHSASRFFRDAALMELNVRELRKAGVRLEFVTQPLSPDSTGDLVRQLLGVFDEYQSRETSKHVVRTMKANAIEGFWNGAPAPYGYETYVAEIRGKKEKKKLRPDAVEASIVRQIFDMAETGCGCGPMGVKAIVNALHEQGVLTRRGKPWHVQTVHTVLTSEAAKGVFWYNTSDHKTGEPRPASEHIRLEYEPIIEPDRWERVRSILRAKNPKIAPPKVVSGPILLTGLLRCETCGSAMTLRTGKSGRYKYYACAGAQARGPAVCTGLSLRMDCLDKSVSDALAERFFAPDRLEILLRAVIAADRRHDDAQRRELFRVETQLANAKERLDRLLDMVEKGLLAATDPDLAKRLDAARRDRDIALAAKQRTESRAALTAEISPEKLVAFGRCLKEIFRNGDTSVRKAYARMFVDTIEVSKTTAVIRIKKSAIRKNIDATNNGMVPISVQEWRARKDSNL